MALAWGVAGAAGATVLAQFVSGIGITVYTLIRFPEFRLSREELHFDKRVLGEIAQLSFLTCLQQSVMNFGILMVQGRVNSFGTAVMAAFAAAVKIDSFAYMPVQDFGNAFSTFIAQNYGAGKEKRISQGIKSAVTAAFVFCLVISAAVCAFAAPLMGIFVNASQTEIISIGVGYLRIEGAFYFGIGLLFLLYGYYRAVKNAWNVRDPYHPFPWNPCGPGLYFVRRSGNRRHRNLGIRSHWMGTGRHCGRHLLLEKDAKKIRAWLMCRTFYR